MADSKLSLKNIHHVYEQKKQAGTEAIRHIDLEVRDGELLAIVGARGAQFARTGNVDHQTRHDPAYRRRSTD